MSRFQQPTLQPVKEVERCSVDFTSPVNGYNMIDFTKLNDYGIKRGTRKAMEQYINLTKKYTEKNCKEYSRLSRSTSTSNAKQKSKNPNNIKRCLNMESEMKKQLGYAMNSLYTQMKLKVKNKINKIQSNPKDKRVQKLACYLKILMTTYNSNFCNKDKTGVFTIDTLIADMKKKFISSETPYYDFADAYIKYLLYNRKNSKMILSFLQKLNTEFAKSLTDLIDNYSTCSETISYLPNI